ncbi:hypothetical protein VTK73DRAFT_3144 [Phialemonium thermophilum]|uniref:Uncharacterized protein n=1 Tax=Phialemonium thermophilum TaxID=223376 RepID=A0ABR3X0L3_9PEZI
MRKIRAIDHRHAPGERGTVAEGVAWPRECGKTAPETNRKRLWNDSRSEREKTTVRMVISQINHQQPAILQPAEHGGPADEWSGHIRAKKKVKIPAALPSDFQEHRFKPWKGRSA